MKLAPTLIKRTLAQHEEIIAAAVNSFLDVGRSLMAIRDERLWEKEHESFEAYCKTRWGFAKARAYQLIESAVVVSDLSTTGGNRPAPENERQVRAIADAAPDAKTRAVVWEAAVESAPKDAQGNSRITAAVVRKAAAGVNGARSSRRNGHAANGSGKNGKQPAGSPRAKSETTPAPESPQPESSERLTLVEALPALTAWIQTKWPLEAMDILPAKLRKLAAEIEKGLVANHG